MIWVSFYVSEICDVEMTLIWSRCQDVESDVAASEIEDCDAENDFGWDN
jgi:hypothetical protein